MAIYTRRELYDLVWSTPMTKLAESFGLSDVALSNACERHRIPTPPRGYWAKKASGQKVKEAIFVQVNDQTLDRVEINSSRANMPEPLRQIVEQRRLERKATAKPAPQIVIPPPDFAPVIQVHPAIRATAAALRKSSASSTHRGVASGPGLCGISVSAPCVERVIFTLNGIARACDARGILLVPKETRVSVSIGSDDVSFEIKEKTKRVPHVLTEKEKAEEEKRQKQRERTRGRQTDWAVTELFPVRVPEFDIADTGELGLEINGYGTGLRRSWRDGKMQLLEKLVDEIVDGIEAHLTYGRIQREARQKAEAERRELVRRHGLIKARTEREEARTSLLTKLMQTGKQASELRGWLADFERKSQLHSETDVTRLISWVHDQLSKLETALDLENLHQDLKTRKLFPEIDDLHDPLGEPPPIDCWRW